MFVFLFVYLELIEELAEATDLKFGMHVEHVVSRNNTKDISDIFTNEPLRLLKHYDRVVIYIHIIVLGP